MKNRETNEIDAKIAKAFGIKRISKEFHPIPLISNWKLEHLVRDMSRIPKSPYYLERLARNERKIVGKDG